MLYTADFETTTDENDCRVWAVGLCDIGNTENFIYGNNIKFLMDWLKNQEEATLYFHNLKFDGEFIINWLFENGYKFVNDKKHLDTKSFTTLISDKGQFYSLEICFEYNGKELHKAIIYDSLKILPFSVEDIAGGFNLPLSKLSIDYDEKREENHELTEIEINYLRNDVEIVARALKVLFDEGLTKMTQGSNALYDYKRIVTDKNFNKWFPIPAYDSDIRQAYKGGFTFCNPRYKSVDIGRGIVLDVNSLYPSVMYACALPYGEGIKFSGKYEKDKIYNLYVQMLTCNFQLKKDHIPTIQLKNNLAFVPTNYLESSEGEDVTLCLTNIDLELFFDHYDVYNITYHSGWKFKSTLGLFKEYIDKWMKVKIESDRNGNKAMRTLAKLMLNALYGKFALNPNVQSKNPYYVDGMVKYKLGDKETRNPIYIPVGAFVTAYARDKTIRSAQKVYDRFLYADTDSLHLIGTELPKDLDIDPVKLGAWKHEATFTHARFLRQKSYVEEHIVSKEDIDKFIKKNPKRKHHVNLEDMTILNITCAGLPDRCYPTVTWDNFLEGAEYDGKLQMKHVQGGIVLKDIKFSIKK